MKEYAIRIIKLTFAITCIEVIRFIFNAISDFNSILISLWILITICCYNLIKDIYKTQETKEIIRKGFIAVIVMILVILWAAIVK